MGLRELKAEYVAAYEGKSPKGLSTRLDEGIEYFEARGISLPSESDIQAWSEEQKTRPGRKSGQTRSEATIKDYAREFKKFIDWCKQKGERSMTLDFEATQPVAEASPEDNMEVTEATEESETSLSAPVEATQPVHERASEATQGVHEPESEATEATQTVEVEEFEQPVAEASTEVEPVQGVRRGRKRNPDRQGRIQVSVYLPHDTYEAIRLLAPRIGKNITTLFEDYAESFVMRNFSELQKVKSCFNSLDVKP